MGSNPATPTIRRSHELAHETFAEEGVRGRRAEYPDDEDARELAREASEAASAPQPFNKHLTGVVEH
ncbi:hypothetical protein GZ998_02810 [Actinomyces sp. 594]|uniref:hypothetical protein n=1 Tax=Actinomyces sp. 594 TaxID=2057793 RepID=UPI001C596006|nr:hypothetical protein [Actinomyces sp. 594]MBW3068445.1 hypothetical protein [Actinomyces sp. 594]